MRTDISFSRFLELDKNKINRDYHVHTNWIDGENSAGEIIEQAEKLQLESIAFTEHIRHDSNYYSDFYHQIEELRKDKKVQIFIGVETKIMNLDGDLDISQENYEMADLVLGSVHSLPTQNGFINPQELPTQELFLNEYQLALAMIRHPRVNVLAHPGGMSIMTYHEFPAEYLEDIVKEIAKTNIALEINARYTNDKFFKDIIRFCKMYNPFISLGSDVHNREELGKTKKLIGQILC